MVHLRFTLVTYSSLNFNFEVVIWSSLTKRTLNNYKSNLILDIVHRNPLDSALFATVLKATVSLLPLLATVQIHVHLTVTAWMGTIKVNCRSQPATVSGGDYGSIQSWAFNVFVTSFCIWKQEKTVIDKFKNKVNTRLQPATVTRDYGSRLASAVDGEQAGLETARDNDQIALQGIDNREWGKKGKKLMAYQRQAILQSRDSARWSQWQGKLLTEFIAQRYRNFCVSRVLCVGAPIIPNFRVFWVQNSRNHCTVFK